MASREGLRDRKPGRPAEAADSRMHVDGGTPEWVRQAGADTLLQIHAQPGAKAGAVLGVHGGRLKVAIVAPPVEGKANAALLDFLSTVLRCPRRQLYLHAGAASRKKCVRVEGAKADEIAQRLRVCFASIS